MIPFVKAFDFAYGRRDKVSPLIERVVANNPGPFTFTGTGTYIVGAPDAGSDVAVIDPGPNDAEHLEALLEALSGRTVSTILLTHTHRDHAPLARPLAARTGARILAARPPRLQTHASDSKAVGLDEGDDPDLSPDVILTGGERIVGKGWTLRALFTPGHASNHTAFALEEENALFCGDHVMGWATTVVAPPDGSMRDYLASLDLVIDGEFATLWPTHGAPILEPQPFLNAYKAHRLGREAQVLAQLGIAPRQVSDIVPILYAEVDRRLWPAASLSVLAHLIKLVEDGAAVCQGAPGLEAFFSKA